ncbi:hypothetical protein niasHT_000561 [Heterodera trifolii]|uniref:Uncharacterized protein n=1 Tax=Heterodera trifolii TaxID=157864 RepID=A0ABD2M4A3_9BILA
MMDNLIDGMQNLRLKIMDNSESARLFKFDETNANKLLLKAEKNTGLRHVGYRVIHISEPFHFVARDHGIPPRHDIMGCALLFWM